MRRELAVALLLLLAGCSGFGGTGTPDTTTTPGAPESTPTDASGSNTIEYGSLSVAEQQIFDLATQAGAGFARDAVRNSPYVAKTYYAPMIASTFRNNKYVRKSGSYYLLQWNQGIGYATFRMQTSERTPPESATPVSVESLPSGVQTEVRNSIENGSYDVPIGKWDSLPNSLDGVGYVQTGDTSYRMNVTVGDYSPELLVAVNVG